MLVAMIVVASMAVFVGGFVVWYTLWHLRAASCFEALPVQRRRAVHVVRSGATAELDRRSRR